MLFRQLEYLVALSRERHFARAAQACSVSQPALSEAIRKFEEELDVPLVRRGRKYEGLTPEGERIVVWAQRILADRDALRSEVGALRTGLSGRLRIGSVPTSSGAVAQLTGPFCAAHPLVTVEVMADLRSEEILRQLQNFEIDAGVTYLHEGLSDAFRSVPLYEERYVLLTDAADGLAHRTTATWAEASRLPLCLLTGAMQGRRVLDELFAEAGVRPSPRVETDSVAALFAHVRTGRWASIVPHTWLHVFGVPYGMRAVPMTEPARTVQVGLVTTAREPGSVMARALTEVARRTDVAAAVEHLSAAPGSQR
ncbi:LysR family transcriptional regulator [Streptomyces sp. NBC_00257]|uniref:LysR family transcriptional regulator n=1 Tax=unclassified Streptomyces TaxID=2593676 RepID=UPI002258D8AD|nr:MULTISPECIES: LysR family transcriptional regulator [unclassified Streptomyces]WTB52623.1 LysR family transcriptional regulator [Streptomyces sp. NBC_00826]WTH94485.1 LysR family transcriptional regulator [Streptomyces sp. NBC_00825]WTI03220.1 LysR family transcriptional regulator [Streptomyces sp. NBC_00822]MCX4868762.1 LysR family transcriptional regulator [Streptomyces sp. NBC_00906]MCX4900000.1 LysR family transcriptional regulator [Streptomyces sp. NBC_00892]